MRWIDRTFTLSCQLLPIPLYGRHYPLESQSQQTRNLWPFTTAPPPRRHALLSPASFSVPGGIPGSGGVLVLLLPTHCPHLALRSQGVMSLGQTWPVSV